MGATASADVAAEPSRLTPESRLLRRVAVVFVPLLAAEVLLRARYPWDLLMWSESPFMTNLLKLHHGQPIFSPPADVNSFVYSPGLEYLTWTLLAPFGVALDVRWCRAVNVAIGCIAAAAAAGVATRVAWALGAPRRATFWALAGGAVLLLFRNFTADVLHPDNLQMLHAVVTLWLTWEATVRRRFGLALLAVAFASAGVLTKQVEALAVVGAEAALLAGVRWPRRQALAILVTGALASVLVGALLLRSPFARFHLVDLLLAQGRNTRIDVGRLVVSWQSVVFGHRLLLFLLVPGALSRMLDPANAVGRRFVLTWSCLGVTTALPTLSAYLKVMGTWNNLGLADLWMFLLVGPALVAPGTVAPGLEQRLRRVTTLAFVLSLCPLKVPPTPAMYEYGAALEGAIHDDVDAGRHVLLAHGTMPLIRAGATDVPLDRANSALELLAGTNRVPPALHARLEQKAYDRIYLNSSWYNLAQWTIAKHYREIGRIPAVRTLAQLPLSFELLAGHDRLLVDVVIYARR